MSGKLGREAEERLGMHGMGEERAGGTQEGQGARDGEGGAACGGVRVCAAGDLAEGGAGVRFAAKHCGEDAVVFFVRYGGSVYGYLNRCAHVPIELDWVEGQFFESSGLYLMCATHGALYAPETGRCVGGPCRGGRLRPVIVEERDTPEGRAVFWLPEDVLHPAAVTR
jgi:nitrite reductase/ring-hydroxylating ferredoxin subunit